MQYSAQQKRAFVLIGVFSAIVLGIIIWAAVINANKNQYGDSVDIIGYDQQVKNLSKEYKDSITAALYKQIELNSTGEVKASDIKDATIRDGSVSQTEVTKDEEYTGKFIVDIASIKQSYQVQYSYSSDPEATVQGYPILVSCLDVKDLKYGDFNCKDLSGDGETKDDTLVSYLPYRTLDYTLTANTVSDSLLVYAELNIPSSSLGASVASNQAVVAMYKKEVTDWISSKSLDPTKYTIVYNYDDNGNPVEITPVTGD